MSRVLSKEYNLPDRWTFRPPEGIQLVDVRSIDEMDQYQDAWNGLFDRSVYAHPRLSFPWMRAFFKHQVAKPEKWLCLFAFENGQLAGILPLMSSYSLRLAGFSLRLFKLPYHYAHTSGTDCIVAPGKEHLFGLFMDYLNAIPKSLPCLSIKHVTDRSPAFRYLLSGNPRLCFVQKSAGTEAWIPVEDTADQYIASLSGKFRQNLRRAERDLSKLPDIRYRLFDRERSAADSCARFLDVEPRNWKGERKTAIVDFPGSADVFRDAAEGLSAQNQMAFSFIESAGQTVAAHYSMISGRTLYILKMAYDAAFENCSPGNLLMMQVIRSAFESGRFDEINFISDPPLLAKWAVQHRPIWHFVVFPKVPLISRLLYLAINSGKVHNFDIPL